jgi:hypothetical protein
MQIILKSDSTEGLSFMYSSLSLGWMQISELEMEEAKISLASLSSSILIDWYVN